MSAHTVLLKLPEKLEDRIILLESRIDEYYKIFKPYEDRIKLLETQIASLSKIILSLTNNSPISPNITPINNDDS